MRTARGIVHRDLKPANVVITSDGWAKVLDFGLAKRLSGNPSETTTEWVTEPGAVVGTLPYMAPEQLLGKPADARSDVWALGVMLYEMTTGKRPFRGETGFDLSDAIMRQDPPPLPAAIPSSLQGVIERCLTKQADARYAVAEELRAVLEEIERGAEAPAEAPRSRAQQRLAVLPLQNVSGDPDQDYFVNGIHETLITDLAQIRALRVIARPSVLAYNASTPLAEVAEQLKVDAVLTGSVMRAEDRVRITVQLLDATTEEHLWADRYERDVRDVMSLQNEVVTAIAQGIRLQLTPDEQARLASTREVDPRAYEAYLKSRFHWYQFTPEGFVLAKNYCEEALSIDPTYALAHVGLADAIATPPHLGMGPTQEAFPAAKAAVAKALELDENLAEAVDLHSRIRWCYDWDWRGAEAGFRRAIELSPSYADVHIVFAQLLSGTGRHEEALREVRTGLDIDPLNAFFQEEHGRQLSAAGRFVDAIARLEDVLSANPGFPLALLTLWEVLFAVGRFDEALKHLTDWLGDPGMAQALERAHAERGYAHAMRQGGDAMAAASEDRYVSPVLVARFYAHAGDTDQSLRWLERATELKDTWLPYTAMDIDFQGVREDPRYQELMRSINRPG